MSETMFERVAKAIGDVDGSLSDRQCSDYARAALLAMEYPTEKMIAFGLEELNAQQPDRVPPHPPERVPYIAWRGMIEAAISDSNGVRNPGES
jgi:hypothetical protein